MKVEPLSPTIVKVITLMRSSTHEGERSAARAKAETLALPYGGLDRALRILAYEEARAKAPNNFLAGWDEHEEIDNPGHMARRAAEKAERKRIWAERRSAVLERYGSVEAALAPCPREKLILAAVKPWRKVQKRPHQRWTDSIDGWRSSWDRPPPHVHDAIANAYPLPATFQEARAEADYWRTRNNDMEHALWEDGGVGDYALDLAVMPRWNMVRDLAERDLPVDNLPDLVERFRMYKATQSSDPKTEDALLRDLEAIAAAQVGATA